MSAVAEPPAAQKKLEDFDPTEFFKRIIERTRGKPEWLERVTAHVRLSTGHSTLPSFNSASEMTGPDGTRVPLTRDTKRILYCQILKALLMAEKGVHNAFSELKGETAAGQASSDPAPVKAEPAAEEPPETTPPPPLVKATNGHALGLPKSTNPLTQALINELTPFLEGLTKSAGPAQIDEEQLRKMIRDSVRQFGAETMLDLTASNTKVMQKIENTLCDRIDNFIKQIPPRDVLQIKQNGEVKLEIKGLVHKQFKTVHGFATARRFHDGFPVCLYAYGAPGGGKSRMFLTLAEAMGLTERYFPYSCKDDDTTAKIIGYQNLATGAFVPGIVYEPYKNGGLCVLSEVDLPAGIITGLNNLIEGDRFTFPNGETVKRHKDFYLIADANTIGLGATAGFVRAKMDAATRTRWAFLKIEYDLNLERALVPAKFKPWVDYVVKVRAFLETSAPGTVYITPRAVINGAALLANGVDIVDVMESFFTGISLATRNTIVSNCGICTL